jgi:hypothetical protein
MELKKEKCNKQTSYSLSDDPNFNEIFENRDKLIQFLKTEYSDCKEKVKFLKAKINFFRNKIFLKEYLSLIH